MEYHQTNGKKISEQAKAFEESDPFDLGQNRFKEIEFLHLNLDIPKEKHLIGLQKRVNSMIQQGLIEEVINLLKSGFSGTEKPLSSIGYKETIDFLHGKIKSKNELAEKINISTRQLAKSQRTFLKKIFPKESFNPITDSDKLLNRIMEFLGLH